MINSLLKYISLLLHKVYFPYIAIIQLKKRNIVEET